MKYYADMMDERMKQMMEDTKQKRIMNFLGFEERMYNVQSKRAESALLGLNVQERRFVAQYFKPQAWVNFTASLQNLANLFLDGDLKKGQLDEQIARIAKLYSEVDLNNALEMESDARYWNIKSQTEGHIIDNNLKTIDLQSKLPPNVIKKLAWQVFRTEMSRNLLMQHNDDRMDKWNKYSSWWQIPVSQTLNTFEPVIPF